MTALEQTIMDAVHYQMLRDIWMRDPEITVYTAGVQRDHLEAAEKRARRAGRYRPVVGGPRKNPAHY